MSSQRAKEGYLLIDNRYAPPVDPETIRRSGKDVVSPGTGLYESATYTCSHCNAIVVLNPARTRERHWCWNCDHIICDVCAELRTTAPCLPMAKRIEDMQTALIRGRT